MRPLAGHGRLHARARAGCTWPTASRCCAAALDPALLRGGAARPTSPRPRRMAGPAGRSATMTSRATSPAGRRRGRARTRWRRCACAMLASLRGTICLYQGEETGQVETEMEFHELTDPPGHRVLARGSRAATAAARRWCGRTRPRGGSRTGTPWLPVKAPQRARAVAAQPGELRGLGAGDLPRGAGASGAGPRICGPEDQEIVHAGDQALVLRRGGTLCLLNLSNRPLTARGLGAACRAEPWHRGRGGRPLRLGLLPRPGTVEIVAG